MMPNTGEDQTGQAGKDLTSSLIALFKRLIAEGALSPGDRLPPERELAERIGVSRSSLRPALKVLENMGLISQRVGSGTTLNPVAASILSEPLEFLILLEGISFQELMEARRIVEPELAARAAQRASEEGLQPLRQALTRMKASVADPARFAQADLSFHQAVYRAAGNRVCTMLFTVVHQSLESLIRATSSLGLVEPEKLIRYHSRIYLAIRRGDADAARQRMTEHLEESSARLTRGASATAQSALEGRIDLLRPPAGRAGRKSRSRR
jgi:GntR family transcriptional regulator, transcriptional repressor for pyruvate dehydrogenase complex